MENGSSNKTTGGPGSPSSNTSQASESSETNSSSSSAPKNGSGTENADSSKGTPKSTLGGFSVLPPGFNPDDKDSILKHYESKKQKGVLPKDSQFEDNVEDEIKRVIADWEAVSKQKATADQRRRMADKIRSIRGGAWLESLKPQLAGKAQVPIEYFNRLAEQHEATVLHTMRHMSDASKKIEDKDKEIEDLQKKLKDKSGPTTSPSNTSQELKKLKEENARLKQENTHLKGMSESLKKDTQKSEDKAEDLEDKLSQRETKVALLEAEVEKLKAAAKKASKEGESGDIHLACKAEISRLKRKLDVANSSKQASGKSEEATGDKKSPEKREAQWEDEKARMTKEIDKNQAYITQLEGEILDVLDILANVRGDELNMDKGSIYKAHDKATVKLKGEIRHWKERAENSEKQSKDLSDKLAKAQEPKPDSDADKCEKERKKLNKEVVLLREQVSDLQSKLKKSKKILPPADAEKADFTEVIKKLKNENATITKAQDRYRRAYMAKFIESEHNGHLRNFWDIVENTQAAMGELQQRVETLFQNLGMNAPYSNANDALNQMISASTRVRGASQAMQLVSSKLEARSYEVLVYKLRDQIANTPPRKTDDEIKMELRIYNEAELARRVDLETEMYSLHRRAYLKNIFSARDELVKIATGTPHHATRDLINKVRAQYLDVESLPMPPAVTVQYD
ncbi:hypothetical protein F4810DRAFT_710940 [Camillea tinctor]|nr:hypothetical protein F4810DRAFT_710940 [Camillea tinctor]